MVCLTAGFWFLLINKNDFNKKISHKDNTKEVHKLLKFVSTDKLN